MFPSGNEMAARLQQLLAGFGQRAPRYLENLGSSAMAEKFWLMRLAMEGQVRDFLTSAEAQAEDKSG